MISVIIPAYNTEKYIKRCLESVFSQENSTFEVVVINDGSTDNTGDICKDYICYPNFVYEEQPNKGQGSARNRAIEISHGDWLVFLDSDDELCEGCLNSVEKCIEKNPETEIIQYAHEVQFPNGDLEKHMISEGITDNVRFVKYGTTFLWDKAIKKDLWKRLGIILSNKFGEDIKASYLCGAFSKNFELLNEVLVKHFIRGDNLSCNRERVKELPESLKETIEEFIKFGSADRFRPAINGLLCNQICVLKNTALVNYSETERVQLIDSIRQLWKMVDDYELILIGMHDYGWICDIYEMILLEAYDHILLYETVDKFNISDNSSIQKKQIYVIDIGHEMLEVKTGVRTEKWVKDRFSDKSREFCRIALMRGKPEKILVLDEQGLNPPLNIFESMCETEIIHEMDSRVSIYPIGSANLSYDASEIYENRFWNKIEQYRYEVNEVILAGWIKLKINRESVADYFREKEYKSVCIYGMGCIGKLLYDELSDEGIVIDGLMESKRGLYNNEEIITPDDYDYDCDVIVVTPINAYHAIRHEIHKRQSDVCVISIEKIISEMMSEEKNVDHT